MAKSRPRPKQNDDDQMLFSGFDEAPAPPAAYSSAANQVAESAPAMTSSVPTTPDAAESQPAAQTPAKERDPDKLSATRGFTPSPNAATVPLGRWHRSDATANQLRSTTA
ncbi:hypothetical protein [Rhodopirellula baltica]|uniref:hypothetical protein n=1 Tax=Rhodopirellula baltica TaxID=265606 RepID=UPI0002FC74C9